MALARTARRRRSLSVNLSRRPWGNLPFEDAVLLAQILDDGLLLSIHPTGDSEEQELDELGLHPAEDT